MAARFVEIATFLLVLLVATNATTALDGAIGTPTYELALLIIIAASYVRIEAARADRQPLRMPPLLVLVALGSSVTFGLIRIASSALSPFEGPSDVLVDAWLRDMLVVIAIVMSVRSLQAARRLSWAIVAAMTVLAIPTLIQHLTGTYDFEWFGLAQTETGSIDGEERIQVGGPLGGANPLAQWLVVSLPVVVHHAMSAPSALARRTTAVLAFLGVSATVATQSRQGLLLLVLAAVLLLAFYDRPKTSSFIRLVGAGAGLSALVIAANPERWTRQVERISEARVFFGGEVNSNSSAAGYAGTFRAGLDMFADYPVLGIGHGRFAGLYQTYAPVRGIDTSGRFRAAHNSFVHVLAESGSIGFVVFLAFILSVLLVASRTRATLFARNDEQHARLVSALGISFSLWLAACLFTGLFHTEQMTIIAALGLALGAVVDGSEKPREPGQQTRERVRRLE